MLTLFSILLFGFFLGMRHALDADHVVAVTTFVSRERSVKPAALIGVVWGIGHSVTVVLVGIAITMFGLVISPRLGMSLEFCVALMLIVLGLWNLEAFLNWTRQTTGSGASSSQESRTEARLRTWLEKKMGSFGRHQIVRAFVVGVVHGLAGSASLALLALPLIQTPAWAVGYLVTFGTGTIAGMALITTAIAWPCSSFAARSSNWSQRLATAAGMLSLGFGIFLVIQIGFVNGLFFARQ